MQFFIGMIIGTFVGIFCMALASSSGYNNAYMDGANDFRDFAIRRLAEMQKYTENITCEQLMEALK